MGVPEPQDATTPRLIEGGAFRMEIGPEVDSCQVALRGELDLECVPALETELGRLLGGPLQTVTVDLSSLEFIDSTGLRCLLRATSTAAESGTQLLFLRPAGQVEQVLELTKIRQALPIAA